MLPEDNNEVDGYLEYYIPIMKQNDQDWSAKCQPFGMTPEQVKQEFGNLGDGHLEENFELVDD